MKNAVAVLLLALGTASTQAAPLAAAPPASAASQAIPLRSTAVKAAENANTPGELRPEQRVIPQISIPLKRRNGPASADPAASVAAGSVPGMVNDGAARCRALPSAPEIAACERALPVSAPPKPAR